MTLVFTLWYAVRYPSKLFLTEWLLYYITKLPSIAPAEKKKVKKLVLCWMNLTAEHVALANPQKISNRAFLTLSCQSSSPDLHIQHEEHDDHLNMNRVPSSPCTMSPSGIEDDHSWPTSPSPDIMLSSCTTSVAQTLTKIKKATKTIAKFQEGAVIGKCLKASDYEEVVGALLVRTMFDYEGLVSTHDTFPDLTVHRQWMLWCWKQALKDTDEWIEISDRMMTLVHKHLRVAVVAIPWFSQSDTFTLNPRLRIMAHEFMATLFLVFSLKLLPPMALFTRHHLKQWLRIMCSMIN